MLLLNFQAIEAEPEASLVAEHLNSLARCVELLGVGCISETYMADLVKPFATMLKIPGSELSGYCCTSIIILIITYPSKDRNLLSLSHDHTHYHTLSLSLFNK